MAGIDLAQGILAGLAGLAQVLNQGARQREEDNLKAAQVLAATKDYTFAPVTNAESPGVLGRIFGASPTSSGQNVFTFAGQPFALQKVVPMSEDALNKLYLGSTKPAGVSAPDAFTVPAPILSYGTTPAPVSRLIPQEPVAAPPAGQSVLKEVPATGVMAQPSPDVKQALQTASRTSGVPLEHLYGVSAIEAGFNPTIDGPVTKFGWRARGLMQLSPDTGKRFGVTNFYDANENALGGAYAWKEALQKANGDIRSAYQQYYNPGASDATTNQVLTAINRFKAILTPFVSTPPSVPPATTGTAAVGTPSVTDVGAQALPGAPTATSTPVQDTAYRAANQQQVQPATPVPAQQGAQASAATPLAAASAEAQAPTQLPTATSVQTPAAATTPVAPASPPTPLDAQMQKAPATTNAYGDRLVQGPHGIVLESIRNEVLQQNVLLRTAYGRNRETILQGVQQASKNWELAAQRTKEYLQDKNTALGKVPAAYQEYIRTAQGPLDLQARLEQVPGKAAMTQSALMAIRTAAASGDANRVGQIAEQAKGDGADEKAIDQALANVGFAAMMKGKEAVTVEKMTAEPKAITAALSAQMVGLVKADSLEAITGTTKDNLVKIMGNQKPPLQPSQWGKLPAQEKSRLVDLAQKDEIAYQGLLTAQRVKERTEERKDEPLRQEAAFLFHPDLLKNASFFQSRRSADDQGYLFVPPRRQEKILALHSANNYMEDMRTLLLGGIDRSGWITGESGKAFPGILPEAQQRLGLGNKVGAILPQGVVSRFLTGLDLKSAVIQGESFAHWAEVYDKIRESFGPSITARGLEGEVGRVPNMREQQSLEIIAKSGLTSFLAAAPLAARAEFDFLQTFIRENTNLLLGLPQHRGMVGERTPASTPSASTPTPVPQTNGTPQPGAPGAVPPPGSVVPQARTPDGKYLENKYGTPSGAP